MLHRAGWSVGDVRILTPQGLRWLVTSTKGEQFIRVVADSQVEAWRLATEQGLLQV